jgi:hypothetical protein
MFTHQRPWIHITAARLTVCGVAGLALAVGLTAVADASKAGNSPAEAVTGHTSVATLALSDARFYVRRLIRLRAGEGFAFHGSYKIDCRRSSRLRFSCSFDAFAGDSVVTGTGHVRYSSDESDSDVHYRFDVSYINDYCQNVTHGSDCVRTARWHH